MQADQGAVERRVRNAAEAGAAAVLVSGTNLPAGSLDVEDGVSVPVVAIPADAGQAALAGGATLDLSQSRALPNAQLMDIAAFSSGGVAFDGRVKPDLVAPGVGLTADAGGQGYATVTGSSAAAAVVAGAAALVAEARPTLTAREPGARSSGSGGRPLRAGLALPVTAQGGGSSIPSTPRPPRSPSSRRRSRSAGPRTPTGRPRRRSLCGTSPAGRSR